MTHAHRRLGRSPDRSSHSSSYEDMNFLSAEDEQELVDQLRRNVDLFTWGSSDMLSIYTKVVSHHLAIHLFVKPVAQRKWEVCKEKRVVINEEVEKNARFITETKYPIWLDNVVLVRKDNNKWRMCVEFTDLSAAYLKYLCSLPHIYSLIDRS